MQRHNITVEFYNLKFDGNFVIDWLLNNGFEHTEEMSPMKGQFTTLISDMNKFYTITVKWENGHITEFRDAAKKFPGMSVAGVATTFKMEITKGEIDYHAERPIGYQPTYDEVDYLYRDVAIVAQALHVSHENGLTRLTVGSDSLAEFKSLMGGANNFRNVFPVLSDKMDAEIRRAYRGGFTYADPRFISRRLGAGLVLDVNSLYPSVMYNAVIPYGQPEYVDGKVDPTDIRPCTIFSVTFTAKLKPDHIPCIQIKGSVLFGSTEYLTEIAEPTTLMVTDVDWALYNDHYDIEVYAYGGGWRFKATRGLFDKYIDKWSHIKETSEGGQRLLAKLQLNSLYGKLCSNPNVTGKIPILEDGRVRYVRGIDARKPPVYTAAGVFITSYARDITIRAAQANYDVFAYADTDSLHLLTDRVPGTIDLHPNRMGAWKHEYSFVEAHYVRAKAYLNLKEDGTYKTAWAGMADSDQKKLTFDSLKDGAQVFGKLIPKSVPGGIVLETSPYTIKL